MSAIPKDHRLGPNTEIFNRTRTTYGPVQEDEKPFDTAYKTLHGNDWPADDLLKDLETDRRVWPNVPQNIKHMITHVLAFFLHADAVVGDMAKMFSVMVENPVIQAFFHQQIANETVHQEAYFLMAKWIFAGNDPETFDLMINKKDKLLSGSLAYRKKLEWAERWIHPDPVTGKWPHPCEQLIAFGVTEGILFASSFGVIFFVKSLQEANRKCDLHGVFLGNQLVMQDENLHFQNTAALFRCLKEEDRIPLDRIYEIIRSAIDAEDQFIDETIPHDLIGLPRKTMKQYVRYVADKYTDMLRIPRIYNVDGNPLSYMERITVNSRNNPFERKGHQYGRHLKGRLSASTGSLGMSFFETPLQCTPYRKFSDEAESASTGSESEDDDEGSSSLSLSLEEDETKGKLSIARPSDDMKDELDTMKYQYVHLGLTLNF